MATTRKSNSRTEEFVYTCPYCNAKTNSSLCLKRECRRKYYADLERRRAEQRAQAVPGPQNGRG